MSTQLGEFTAYSVGLCYASVCTTLDDAAATARLNLEYPTGVTPWVVSDEPFASKDPNPTTCPDNPQARHVLFEC